ncbi:hypothetical protein [Roseomonas sp. WA12]
MNRPLLLLAALATLPALTACGRVGPIRPPGPANEIIYPRLYPTLPPTTPGAGTAATPTNPQTPGGVMTPGPTPADMPIERSDVPLARPGSPR